MGPKESSFSRNPPDILWTMAQNPGISGDCVAISKMMQKIFPEVRGFSLPINVGGVIGAIVADLGLDPVAAKALFILGRVAECCETETPMRPCVSHTTLNAIHNVVWGEYEPILVDGPYSNSIR